MNRIQIQLGCILGNTDTLKLFLKLQRKINLVINQSTVKP